MSVAVQAVFMNLRGSFLRGVEAAGLAWIAGRKSRVGGLRSWVRGRGGFSSLLPASGK